MMVVEKMRKRFKTIKKEKELGAASVAAVDEDKAR